MLKIASWPMKIWNYSILNTQDLTLEFSNSYPLLIIAIGISYLENYLNEFQILVPVIEQL